MKVLFVGFGSIAGKHHEALRKLKPDAIIYALKSGTQPSEVSDIIDIFNWNEVPSDITFAIISNPTFKHTEALTELVRRSIPVFIEKPLSDTLEGLEVIEKQIREQKLITYVACNLRFLPVLQFLKNVILPQTKEINEVTVYCGSYLPNWRPEKNYRDVYSSRKEMGGGVHLDLFHELDYTYWLFGKPTDCFKILRSKSSLNISAYDFANYQFIYPNFTSSITLNYYRLDPKRTIEIVTSSETFLVNLLSNTISNSKCEIIFANQDFTTKDTYLVQMNYFLGILCGINPPINTFSESLQILKICLNSEKTNG
jgi:predicted dehydrogenase